MLGPPRTCSSGTCWPLGLSLGSSLSSEGMHTLGQLVLSLPNSDCNHIAYTTLTQRQLAQAFSCQLFCKANALLANVGDPNGRQRLTAWPHELGSHQPDAVWQAICQYCHISKYVRAISVAANIVVIQNAGQHVTLALQTKTCAKPWYRCNSP